MLRTQFRGSWDVFEERARAPDFDWSACDVLYAAYAAACAYAPDPSRPGKALVPFDMVGRPIENVWARWLALDPVRMAARHVDALRGMRTIRLCAGLADEFFLDLGATALSNELTRLGVEHAIELVGGGHDAVDALIPATIGELARALS